MECFVRFRSTQMGRFHEFFCFSVEWLKGFVGLGGSGSVVDLQFIVVSNITLSITDTSSLFKILMLGVRTHKLMQVTLH